MLTQRQLDRYAEVLLWALWTARGQRFKRNELVMLNFDFDAVNLAEILQEKLLRKGMNPILRAGVTPTMERNFFGVASEKQLTFVAPGEKELYGNLNGSIHIRAPKSLRHLSGIDPKRIGKAAVSRKPLRDILEKREQRGLYSWTLCMVPTEGMANEAGLSSRQFTREVIRACYLDEPDPVRAWRRSYKEITAIKDWLNAMHIEHLHIEGEKIDLKITPGEKRKWIGLSGHNIPSFEIFLSPDWRGTEGIYFADQPSFRSGNHVEEVQLEFRKGVVVRAKAKKGQNFLLEQLSMDQGAARVGEFSLTDKRFSRIRRFMANTLFDENYGGRYGNCHLAVGSSYSDSYSGNVARLTQAAKQRLGFNDSALHWDLVNTQKKRVTAKLARGERLLIYENGQFNR